MTFGVGGEFNILKDMPKEGLKFHNHIILLASILGYLIEFLPVIIWFMWDERTSTAYTKGIVKYLKKSKHSYL